MNAYGQSFDLFGGAAVVGSRIAGRREVPSVGGERRTLMSLAALDADAEARTHPDFIKMWKQQAS